jgi:hypothetical protein
VIPGFDVAELVYKNNCTKFLNFDSRMALLISEYVCFWWECKKNAEYNTIIYECVYWKSGLAVCMYIIMRYGIDSDGLPQTVVQKLLSFSLLIINLIYHCICYNITPGIS